MYTPASNCAGSIAVTNGAPSGYIANYVTEATGCGGLTNPWVLLAGPGQRISLVLYDFNVARGEELNRLNALQPLTRDRFMNVS